MFLLVLLLLIRTDSGDIMLADSDPVEELAISQGPTSAQEMVISLTAIEVEPVKTLEKEDAVGVVEPVEALPKEGIVGEDADTSVSESRSIGKAFRLNKIDLDGYLSGGKHLFPSLPESCFIEQNTHHYNENYYAYKNRADLMDKIAIRMGLTSGREIERSLTGSYHSSKSGHLIEVLFVGRTRTLSAQCLKKQYLDPILLRDLGKLSYPVLNPHLRSSWRMYEVFLAKWGTHLLLTTQFGVKVVLKCTRSATDDKAEVKSDSEEDVHVFGGTTESQVWTQQRKGVMDNALISRLAQEALTHEAPIKNTWLSLPDLLKSVLVEKVDLKLRSIALQAFYKGFHLFGCSPEVMNGHNVTVFVNNGSYLNPTFKCMQAIPGCQTGSDCHTFPFPYLSPCYCAGKGCVGLVKDGAKTKRSRQFANRRTHEGSYSDITNRRCYVSWGGCECDPSKLEEVWPIEKSLNTVYYWQNGNSLITAFYYLLLLWPLYQFTGLVRLLQTLWSRCWKIIMGMFLRFADCCACFILRFILRWRRWIRQQLQYEKCAVPVMGSVSKRKIRDNTAQCKLGAGSVPAAPSHINTLPAISGFMQAVGEELVERERDLQEENKKIYFRRKKEIRSLGEELGSVDTSQNYQDDIGELTRVYETIADSVNDKAGQYESISEDWESFKSGVEESRACIAELQELLFLIEREDPVGPDLEEEHEEISKQRKLLYDACQGSVMGLSTLSKGLVERAGPDATAILLSELNSVQDTWEDTADESGQQESRLNAALEDWQDFNYKLDSLTEWVEDALSSLAHDIPRITGGKQLKKLSGRQQALEDEMTSQEPLYEEVCDKGTYYTNNTNHAPLEQRMDHLDRKWRLLEEEVQEGHAANKTTCMEQ